MKRNWIVAIILGAALAIGSLAAGGPGGNGTVGGQVLDAKDKPVAGAHVTLQDSEGGHLQTGETNSQGHFWFPFLPEGQYSVRASDPGRASEWVKNVWVSPGHETDVTLHLHPKKSAPSTGVCPLKPKANECSLVRVEPAAANFEPTRPAQQGAAGA